VFDKLALDYFTDEPHPRCYGCYHTRVVVFSRPV